MISKRILLTLVAAIGLGSVTAGAASAIAAPKTITGSSETLVTTLFKTLTREQKEKVAFPFDHPLRSKVDNNWFITPVKIGKFFTPDQQAMIEEIFRKLHNPDFVEKVMHHIQEDAKGLPLVIISAMRLHEAVQRGLAHVPERGMAQVVRQTDRLGQVLVAGQRARQRATDLGYLYAVS